MRSHDGATPPPRVLDQPAGMTAGEPQSLGNEQPGRARFREVVLGRNAKVWQTLSADRRIGAVFAHAIGHADLAGFAFTPDDRVWVLSYSRDPAENAALLNQLGRAGVAEVVYVSSSSCIVAAQTGCYEYPRVKLAAELQALALQGGKVLTIGLFFVHEDELPAGDNVGTSATDLADFMLAPRWPDGEGRRMRLFRRVQRPFSGPVERMLHRAYGVATRAAGRFPCLLRPVDLVLRALRMRWYGYVYLSNRLWISTIS